MLALVESERRYYQEIVATIPVGLLILSSDLEIISSNREARVMFGVTGGVPPRSGIDRYLPSPIVAKLREAMAAGTPMNKVRMPLAGQPGRTIRISMRQIRNWEEESEPETLLTIEEDYGPRGRTPSQRTGEDALPEAGLADSMEAIVWAAALPDKRFLFVNQRAAQWLGYPVETWLNTPSFWADRVHPEDRDTVLRLIEDSLARQSKYSCEFRALTSDGRVVWLRELGRVLEDESGQPRHVIGIATDITEQRFLEAQYVQAQRVEAVATLSTRAGREITNQLLIISGYAEELLAHLDARNPLFADVREIANAAGRLNTLAGQLSSFERRPTPAAGVVDVNALLTDLQHDLRHGLNAAIRFEWKLPAETVAIAADREELEQSIRTLIGRAERISPAGGKVAIAVSQLAIQSPAYGPDCTLRPGRYAVLSVEDTGPSLDPVARKRLFESPLASRETAQEAGPELARIYRNVRQWNGDVAVAEVAPQGTLIRLILPLAERSVEPMQFQPAPVPEVSPAPPEPVIVLADDEPGIRTLIARTLQRQKYTVVEAAGAQEAIQACEQHPGGIDLLIANAALPGMTRRETMDRIRSFRPSARIIFLTGEAEDEQEFNNLPPNTAVLKKPFTLAALASKVKEILAQ